VHPIQIIAARAVYGKGSVRQGLACILLALHTATQCLALSACLVCFVWCVCVIELSVLPQETLWFCNTCRYAGNARPGAAESVEAFSRLRASEFTAPARVLLACLCMRADFVRPAYRVIKHKILCVCVLVPYFLSIFVTGSTCLSAQTSATPSLRGHVVGLCMYAHAHTGLRAHVTFFHGKGVLQPRQWSPVRDKCSWSALTRI